MGTLDYGGYSNSKSTVNKNLYKNRAPRALSCGQLSPALWLSSAAYHPPGAGTVSGWELRASPVVGDVNVSPLQRQAERHTWGPGDTARHHVRLSWLRNMAVWVFLFLPFLWLCLLWKKQAVNVRDSGRRWGSALCSGSGCKV